MSKLALIDLDGTMADYDSAMMIGMMSLVSPGEDLSLMRNGIGFNRDTMPLYLQAREKMVRSQPGFYRDLNLIPLGFFIVNELKHLGYDLHVATKAPFHNTAIAAQEKVEWCQKHLPGVPVTVSGDKSILQADILFDDWPGYIVPWLEKNPFGMVLMPSWPWNKDFEHKRVYRVKPSFTGQIAGLIEHHEKFLASLNR